ncbi:MAG: hypothetical protein Q4G46_01530, partial [Propionibacteriaceae bacterium]|nr:hypothetical protein [Propionibacteriaceae bacterium]
MTAFAMVGVLIGSGVTSTVIGVSDGVTWLSNGNRGEVLQYNPGSNRVEQAYRVGQPGDEIAVTQGNGVVALRNERTGEIMTVDMSRMQAGGVRTSHGRSKVVVARGMMFVLDTESNRLSRVDPVRAKDLGEPWVAPGNVSIADVAADDEGTVWVVDSGGMLRGLSWQTDQNRFVERQAKRVALVGDDAVLTGHETGVSVFGPRAGVIAQVGTKNDGYRQSSLLVGVDPARLNGPSDLVSGAMADKTSVVIVDRGEVRVVPTGELDCHRPARPVAFNDTVYVVCQGSKKVIQLTRDGKLAGPPIATLGNADPEPVTDEGRLLFNVGGAPEGIQISRGGDAERFDRLPLGGTRPMEFAENAGETAGGALSGREQAREDINAAPPSGDPAAHEEPGRTSVGQEVPREENTSGGVEPVRPATNPVVPPALPVEVPTQAPSDPSPRPAGSAPMPVQATQPTQPAQREPDPVQPGPHPVPTARVEQPLPTATQP